MSNDIAIKSEDLAKRYMWGHGIPSRNTLGARIAARVRNALHLEGAENDYFWALRGVSFEIRHGENIGFIGRNGAGKSTTLKILSRITAPTRGKISIHGRLGALLEVGTGFHTELTGRENVYLYGSILGMRKEEIRQKFDAIVEFSEIGSFLDTPVKRYSSGMYVRLAFAVAAHLDPDILLLDEVLAVGDLTFQRKCIDFTKGLQANGTTILFVSHNMFTIKNMCTRAIYLRGGKVAFDGPVDAALAVYEDDCRTARPSWQPDHVEEAIAILDAQLTSENGDEKSIFDFGERMVCTIHYRAEKPIVRPNFILSIHRNDEVHCCNFSSEVDGAVFDSLIGEGVLTLVTPRLKLTSDGYMASVTVRAEGFKEVIAARNVGNFHIRHALLNHHFGVFHESAEWKLSQLTGSNR
jgi:lipopolysaccharide transport system ATP-binding protein